MGAPSDALRTVFRPSPTNARLQGRLYLGGAAVLPIVALLAEGFVSFLGSLLVSAAIAFVGLRELGRASDGSPRLIVDADGISLPGFFAQRVPWSAVRNAWLSHHYKYGDMLVIEIPDSPRFDPLESRSKQSMLDSSRGNRYTLSLAPLDGSARDVRAAIDRFAPGLLRS